MMEFHNLINGLAPLYKFAGEQNLLHNGTLQWPGYMGLPVRTSRRLTVKEEELPNLMHIVCDFHCRIFDLLKEEDREYYKWIRDRAAVGWFIIVERKTCFPDSYDNFDFPKIYLEWYQTYYEPKPDVKIDEVIAES